MIEDYWPQTLETLDDAVCISDPQGTILYLNKRYEEVSGVCVEGLIGRPVGELVERGIVDVVLNPEIVKSRQPQTRVQEVSNGRRLLLLGRPVFDAMGELALVISYIRDITKISQMREQMAAQQELLEAYQRLQSDDGTLEKVPPVLHSRTMQQLFGTLETIAETDATVLLLGETGVGKDLFAKRLHKMSSRSEKAFVKVDCGSIPEGLVETELFGYAAGAFSGASQKGKVGLVEAASGGTIFLDEVAELPLLLQTRLLRLLQDKEILRVGATASQKVDVRIVAATNSSLEDAVASGRFRSDLYYRLKVAVVTIPPLRKRRADILPLAKVYLQHYCRKYGREKSFAPNAEAALLAHAWPGNVRELANVIQGLVVSSRDALIQARDLPFAPEPCPAPQEAAGASATAGRSMREILEDVERSVILQGMERLGSYAALAQELGLDRSTVYRKYKRFRQTSRS